MLISLPAPLFREKANHDISSGYFSVLVSLLFLVFYNASFFGALIDLVDCTSLRGVIFIANVAILLWLLTFIVISIFTIPYIGKPLICIIFVSAACVAYFMDTYGIVIHRLMIQNMVETDSSEVLGLLNKKLFLYVLAIGLLPSLLILSVDITFESFKKELWKKTKFIAIAFIASLVLMMGMSKDYASFFRNHKSVRQMANPINFIYAGISYLTTSDRALEVKPIEKDAAITPFGKAQTKPTLFILVLGETARADHFGINGYARDTTPLLAQENIINFTQVASCGTETAVSVPCMFSVLDRDKFSGNKAKSQEGLLDVVNHAGISVLWRDNNSSCKGTCKRVAYESVQHLKVNELCNGSECFDEILLHQLNEKIAAMPNPKMADSNRLASKMIVLHQKGSHGPDYFNRYPQNKEHFTPTCKDNQLQNCAKEELTNAYDNTIRYTDYFLSSTLKWLSSKNSEYNTALIYVSDHGESLGEKNLYLHGMPYAIAPKEQTQVPFFLWFSRDFEKANAIDSACLRKISNAPYTHDHLFHTVLGMLNVSTRVYKSELDIVKTCRHELRSS
jgi:lipid A ethanolaminephosphotransferase